MMGNSNSGRLVLLPINFARLMKKTTGGYTLRIVTSAATHGDDQLIARRILRNLKGDTPGKKDSFVLQMNESALSSLNSIGTTLKMGGGIIGFITILGASIGLLNIMIVSVKERTREIGVRKSLGATTAAIRLQFLMEAIMICLVGGAIGTLLGLGIGNLVPVLTGSDSFVIPYDWIILGFVTSVLVGVLSGYMPANSAARVDPVESLRYE
jgi:putative ABC transport system permease protein